jgi:hypothetical protein
MNGTHTGSAAQRGGRGPSSLADSQLDHLENMVDYVARESVAMSMPGFDHRYWEKRIRSLEQTYELVASQHRRMARLRDKLTGAARMELERRAAA